MPTSSKPYKVTLSGTVFPDRKPVLVLKVPKSVQLNLMRRDNGDVSMKFESPEGLQNIGITVEQEDAPVSKPAPKPPVSKAGKPAADGPTASQKTFLAKLAGERGLSQDDLDNMASEQCDGKDLRSLSRKQFSDLIDSVKDLPRTDR